MENDCEAPSIVIYADLMLITLYATRGLAWFLRSDHETICTYIIKLLKRLFSLTELKFYQITLLVFQ